MTDTVFILDRNKNVIDYLSNNGVSPDAPFFDDIYTQELSNGAETYEFSTLSNARISEALELGNYVVFKYDNKYKMFQIMDLEDDHKDGKQIINCYCEMAGLELLTDYCEPFSIEGNVELFFNTVLQDTNWSLGGYSSSLATNIQQVKIDKYTNVYKVIQENIGTYGNIEIEYRVEFDGNRLLGYFIDVYANAERGNKTYKRFEYGENVNGITRKRNLNDFASAMIGQGKDKLTFKDIEWKKSNGDPADKPKGQDFVVDLEANDKFNKHGKYIKGLLDDSDITNAQDLLLKSWEKLQEVKEPKFDYEVDLALTGTEYEDIKVGDTVYVIDNEYNPPIFLEARVGKPELSLSDSTVHKCTLSNYKEVASKIREPKDGENGKTPEIGDNGNWWIGGTDTNKPSQGLPGANGEPAKYIIVSGEQVYKYANGFEGDPTPSVITITSTAFGMNVTSRTWSYKTPAMSDYVNMSYTEPSIVVMHNDEIWGVSKSITIRCSVADKYDEITLVKVADGSQGTQGNGVKSTQEEFYLSSDKANQPSETDSNWTTTCPQWKPGKYIWTRIKMTYTNNNVEYVGYSVDTSWEAINDVQIGGRNILVGGKLTTYSPNNSKDIETTGTDKLISTWNPAYTGRTFTLKNSDSVPLTGVYTFSGFVKVNDAIPTEKYFLNISSQSPNEVYENYYDPVTGYFRIVQDLTGAGTWIIHALTAREGGSTDVVTLTNYQLEKGNKATDYDKAPEDTDHAIGNNVANVDVMFYLSSSNTELKDGQWRTTAPEWVDGKYMWQKTVTTLGNGYTKETDPTCIAGAKGDSGYTLVLSNENHAFPCQSNGNIPSAITTTTRVIAFKGTKEITPTIGTLPTIPGLTLNKSGATITIVANTGTSLADSGTFNIPVTVEGVSFIKSFTWAKSRAGGTGPQGNPGTDGKTGQGIESVDVEYTKSMNSVKPPGSGWSTIIPSYEKGYFLWQRTKVVYKDPAKTVYTTPIVDTTWSEIDSVYHSIGVVDGRIGLLIGNSEDETSLTLTPKMMTLLSENLVLSGKNIEINGDTKITGLVTANEYFKINSDGSMTCKKATIEGAITATGNIVLYDNPKGFRGKDTKGNEVTLAHVGMDDCSRFGWGSWERMSAAAYNMGCEYLGGKRAILRSKEQTYLVCNGGTYDAVGGSAIVFLMNSAGDYALRPVAPNKDYLGTGTYYWAGVSSKEFNNTSDRNLKENVKYLSNAENIDINSNISALDCYDFMKNDLPVALYNYIDDFRTKIGVIAQDIVYNADNSNNKVGQLIVNMIPYEENNVGAKLTYDMNNFIGVIAAAQQVNIKKTEGHDERLNKIEKRLELLENGK